MESMLIVVVVQLVAVLLFRLLFGSVDEFLRCLGQWFTPPLDLRDALRLRWDAEFKAELKVGCWIVAPLVVGMGMHHALM